MDIERAFPEIDELYELGEDIYCDIFSKFSNKKVNEI